MTIDGRTVLDQRYYYKSIKEVQYISVRSHKRFIDGRYNRKNAMNVR